MAIMSSQMASEPIGAQERNRPKRKSTLKQLLDNYNYLIDAQQHIAGQCL